MSAHHPLGMSGIYRWSVCFGSVEFTAGLPDPGSSDAARGTLKHSVAESKGRLSTGQITKSEFDGQMAEHAKSEYYDGTVEGETDSYVEFCLSHGDEGTHEWECRLDLSTWIPGEGFGTADHRSYEASTQTLFIDDLKTGKGVPVSAHENKQLMGYALGALEELAIQYDITNVVVSIIQPALDSITSYQISARDLLRWGDEFLAPAANAAWGDNGKTFVPTAEGCRFCRGKAICRARAQAAAADDFRHPNELSDAEIVQRLAKADETISYFKDVKDYAFLKALSGHQWEGFKLVQGRATRKFADQLAVASALADAGFPEEVTHQRSLMNLGDMEDLVGKKRLPEILGDLLVKCPGKPTLVTAADKRESYNPAAADFLEEVKSL